MKEISVGVVGFGTVGAGVVDCLLKNAGVIEGRTGVRIVLKRIADLDIVRDRGVKVPDGILIKDAMTAVKECDIIVELVGGTTFAKTIILEALNQGKSVVTANKALLAKYGDELFAAAEKTGADIYYEASVGGGIPIIKSLREGLAGNRISRIYGILNGTCNYILTRMERSKEDFSLVLADAQKLGYAEAKPSLDIDGYDTAHKTAILASLAYGKWFGLDPVYMEGISDITLKDLQYADELGYRVKLLAIIKQNAEKDLEIRVHPTLIPKKSMLGQVSDVFNAVMVSGDFVGDTLFYGRGAGRSATASAVVGDIVDVALNLANDSKRRIVPCAEAPVFRNVLPMEAIESRYFVRLNVADKPGVLAKVTAILAENEISISTCIQKEETRSGDSVMLILLTHTALERNMMKAIRAFNDLPEVTDNAKMIRIEDL